MDTVTSAAAIVGLVNGVTLLKEQNYWGFGLFCVAIFAGLLFGAFHFWGLDPQSGLMVALASSGFYKGAQVVAGTAKKEQTLP